MRALMVTSLLPVVLVCGTSHLDLSEHYSDTALLDLRWLDATYQEHSPEFTDLYLIEAEDRSRRLYIYCNVSRCYRIRGGQPVA